MSNIAAARRIVELALELGVREFCLCGGSRNGPLLAVLGASESLRRYAFAEERSAAFFALGKSRASGLPVAVVTTSGTAVAELLPATIEAFYSGTPLILITADRPRRFRGTGAPQAIEQRAIFGPYATEFDWEAGGVPKKIDWSVDGPLHWNIAFDEPLIDEEIGNAGRWSAGPQAARPRAAGARGLADQPSVSPELEQWRRPVVLLGPIPPADRDAVRRFALSLGAPVHAEPLSGLREDSELRSLRLRSGDRLLAGGGFDGVLRIGGIPTLRFWRDLEESHTNLPVISLSHLPFAGLTRGRHVQMQLSALDSLAVSSRPHSEFLKKDAEMAARLEALMDSEPLAEPSLIRDLSRILPERSLVYLGNSLPIREWDLVSSREPRGFEYAANRGANGIDGQLSSFFGSFRQEATNWCMIGDLTAIYDLSAPWIANQIEGDFQIVIVNNGGGRIFSRVASLRRVDPAVREKYFEDAHAFRFDHWAHMWGLGYQQWAQIPSKPAPTGRGVIEVLPDAEATRRFWQRYDELWQHG